MIWIRMRERQRMFTDATTAVLTGHVQNVVVSGMRWTSIQGIWKFQTSITMTSVTVGVIASQISSLTIFYSSVYSDADERKHQSSASLTFVWGIHRWPVNSSHKWPVTRKVFSFYDVIMGISQNAWCGAGQAFVAPCRWRMLPYDKCICGYKG